MVNSRDDAESFVGACRYPPAGYRSWGPFRATLQARTDFEGYFAEANDSIVAIALIETVEGLANLDSILETPGLDGVYLGASDLAVAHGGQPGIDYFAKLKQNGNYIPVQGTPQTVASGQTPTAAGTKGDNRLYESDDGPGSELTPMGQVDSIGLFARGLGARRVKIALAVVAGVLLLFAVLAALR